MSDPSLEKMQTIGGAVLAILTLGIFKSVYRRLGTPFRQLFLMAITTGYAFFISLAIFCAIAAELRVISEHFTALGPLLRDPRFAIAIFAALFLSLWVTLIATLGWYFNQRTLIERALALREQIWKPVKS